MAQPITSTSTRPERPDQALATPAVTTTGCLGLPLLVVATARLMLVLDDAVASIALPSIQHELAVSASTLPWIISAYVLVFGGLLLLGGRDGDLFGRRRVLRIGLVVFTGFFGRRPGTER
jgi:MFS family permease